jgi:hypothetical protein
MKNVYAYMWTISTLTTLNLLTEKNHSREAESRSEGQEIPGLS